MKYVSVKFNWKWICTRWLDVKQEIPLSSRANIARCGESNDGEKVPGVYGDPRERLLHRHSHTHTHWNVWLEIWSRPYFAVLVFEVIRMSVNAFNTFSMCADGNWMRRSHRFIPNKFYWIYRDDSTIIIFNFPLYRSRINYYRFSRRRGFFCVQSSWITCRVLLFDAPNFHFPTKFNYFILFRWMAAHCSAASVHSWIDNNHKIESSQEIRCSFFPPTIRAKIFRAYRSI